MMMFSQKNSIITISILLSLPILPHFLNDIYIIYLNEMFVHWDRVEGQWMFELTIGKWVMWVLDFLVYFTAPVMILSFYAKKKWIAWNDFDLKLEKAKSSLLEGLGLGIFVWFLFYLKGIYINEGLLNLFEGWGYSAFFYKPSDGIVPFVLVGFYLMTSAGILEEILYRSFLIKGLERIGVSTISAFIISIIVFIGIHFASGAIFMVNGLIVGIIFGAFYIKKRNILPLCIAHMLLDAALIWDSPVRGILDPIFR